MVNEVVLEGIEEVEFKKESKFTKFKKRIKEDWKKYVLGGLTGAAFAVGMLIMLVAEESEDAENECESNEETEIIFDAIIDEVEEAENDAVEE